jgi:hypothetical protein
MGSWIPMGTAPAFGLLVMSKYYPSSLLGAGIFQWYSQSVNAAVGFCNGSNGSPAPGGFAQEENMTIFAQGYAMAVTSGLALTFGGQVMLRNSSNPLLKRYAPFGAVAAAGCLNTAFVRQHEVEQGIMVTDDDGNPLGLSKIAAKKAIAETCVTRALIPTGSFLLAPFLYNIISRKTLTLIRRPYMALPINIGLTVSGLFVTLPASLALYDQRGSIDIRELEPQISELVPKNEYEHFAPIMLRYHKGL